MSGPVGAQRRSQDRHRGCAKLAIGAYVVSASPCLPYCKDVLKPGGRGISGFGTVEEAYRSMSQKGEVQRDGMPLLTTVLAP